MNKKNKIIISTVAGTLVVSTVISFFTMGYKRKIQQDSPYDGQSITMQSEQEMETTIFYEEPTTFLEETTNERVEQTTQENKKEVKENSTNYKDDYNYNIYLAELNKILSKKSFDQKGKQLILDSYDMLYQNYDNVEAIYKMSDIPTKEEYIKNMFLKQIEENLDTLNLYSLENERDRIAIKSMSSSAEYFYTSKKMNLVNHENLIDRYYMCSQFMHELTHAFQSDFLGTLKATIMKKNNKGLWYIAIEGEGDLSASALLDCIHSDGNSYFLADKQETNLNNNGKTGDVVYNLSYKFNSMFNHLAGYKEVQKIKETCNTNSLEEVINEKYGIDSSKFIDTCIQLANDCQENEIREDFYKDLEYVDDFYLQCLEKEIDKADTKQEIVDFYNYYRYYKFQDQCKYTIRNDEGIKIDVTDERFDFSKIENKLYEKCKENDILQLSDNEETNKKIFNCLLKSNSEKCSIDAEKVLIENEKYLLVDDNTLIVTSNNNVFTYDLDKNTKKSDLLEDVNIDTYKLENITMDNREKTIV